ncbi:MAG: hypothetical protein CMI35_09475 [Owenweeksia sp.]|nr:hypothetical protein [Owenweeksia sp.]|tara:strand:- start:2561 stop:5074 length:2514 start_codon:yes stop_codon:yes gene_type:complete
MDRLDKVLGHSDLVSKIIDQFNGEQRVVHLTGNSGTGKSHVAKEVSERWSYHSDKHEYLILSGDLSISLRQYYPFKKGIVRFKARIAKKSNVHQGISELIKSLPITGSFASFITDYIIKRNTEKQRNELSFLENEELETLLVLNNIFRHKKLLIVAENFHWWDNSSIRLLKLFFNPELFETLKFLETTKILLVTTLDQTYVEPVSLASFISSHVQKEVRTKNITFTIFPKVLRFLGFQLPNEKGFIELLFKLTQGHLELCKKLIDYVNINGRKPLNAKFISEIFEGDAFENQSFIEKLLITRLHQYGASSEDILELLERASIIGLSFSHDEISCLTKDKIHKLQETISMAQRLSLIESESDHFNFSHEVIREVFYCRAKTRKTNLYQSFAECLRILNPSDYEARANLFFESDNIRDSIVYYILAHLKSIRNGNRFSELYKARILQFAPEFGLLPYYQLMLKAYKYFFENNYQASLNIIRSIEDLVYEILVAEKYFLLSLCLSKNLVHHDLIESKNALLNWNDLRERESEIWVRMMMTLVSRYAHLSEYNEAKNLERTLMIYLAKRGSYDSNTEVLVNILRRKASIVHIAEVALDRTEKSALFFQNETIGDEYLYPTQYFMSLTNLSGNLLVMGAFEEAYQKSQQALHLFYDLAEVSFPRVDVPFNNMVLSGWLSNNLSSEEALNLINGVYTSMSPANRSILVSNNLGVLIAMSGNLKKACDFLEELQELLSSGRRKDNYYEFFIRMNLSVVYRLLNRLKESKKCLNGIEGYIPNIPDKAYLSRRLEIIRKELFVFKDRTPDRWQTHILTKYPDEIGPSWSFYGLGFLVSDRQYWSDS